MNLFFNFSLLIPVLINLLIVTGYKYSEMEELLKYIRYDFSSLVKEFGIKDNEIDKEVGYVKLDGLSRVYKEDVFPGHFFFQGDKLVMIYINDDSHLIDDMSYKKITSDYGPGHRLSSRAGKKSNLYVYPESGFAVSVTHNEIDFIEIFPSTTIDDYKNRIHEEVIFYR